MVIKSVEPFFAGPFLLVKITTDDGLVGWGEGLPDNRRSVAAFIEECQRFLIGQNPSPIEDIWQRLYRGFFWKGGFVHLSALSAIDIALWDLKGKALGVPIYDLFGGPTRHRIRLYAHIGGSDLESLKQSATERVGQGFTAVKFNPVPTMGPLEGTKAIQETCERVQTVREVIGWDRDLLLDFHGRTSPAMGLLLARELAPLKPFWIEEPCQPANVDALAWVSAQSPVPIATGERLFTRWDFRPVLERTHVAVLQPDPAICGGLMELRKIAAMAETYYVGVAPHNPYGPVSLAAAFQLAASVPNFVIQEHTTLGKGLLKVPFQQTDGYVPIPTGPGLGIEVDEEAIKEGKSQERQLPLERLTDGSVADW
ncbi:MAG: galactonate dehydratase [Armatimonadetes bacterium]|nr:galactonate dehydratase [Armatimonadota bacterium]MDW8122209.1 galactonate dehydratase [Armatimonadota bacterium]